MKIKYLLFIVFLSQNIFADEIIQEEKNYCKVESINQDWERLLIEYPEDDALLRLYAIRKGLCLMIENGQISLDKAIDVIEWQRVKEIRNRLENRERITKENEIERET